MNAQLAPRRRGGAPFFMPGAADVPLSTERHWDRVYATKPAESLSWYRPHASRSIELLESVANRNSRVIDVGGGASTLVDDLLERGWRDLHVLDISAEALDISRRRLGAAAEQVKWLQADITRVALPPAGFDVWHDLGAFHFLTDRESRAAYVEQLRRSLRPDGHVLIAVFGRHGPRHCGGLPVLRFSAETLVAELGPAFRPVRIVEYVHRTPTGSLQPFVHCHCVKQSTPIAADRARS
jgi:SAM-dependent methyltransferase